MARDVGGVSWPVGEFVGDVVVVERGRLVGSWHSKLRLVVWWLQLFVLRGQLPSMRGVRFRLGPCLWRSSVGFSGLYSDFAKWGREDRWLCCDVKWWGRWRLLVVGGFCVM